MKYKVSTILSMTLALPLMLALNISQSFAATGEEEMDVGNQGAASGNSALSLIAAENLVETVDNWLKLDGQFPRYLSLDELGIESQEKFLIGNGDDPDNCRRFGICES